MKSILINTNEQRLLLSEDSHLIKSYPVSTAVNGLGEVEGSGCTPRGLHIIRAKIGQGAPVNTVFVGRRPTGEIYSPALAEQNSSRDWILTRVLWLSGCEPGRNRLGDCDTMRRYIYIHGCPDSDPMQIPSSHGCIKMQNADVIELFNRVNVGKSVDIRVTYE